MSTAEIKSLLHKLIVETDDLELLGKVRDYFTSIRSKKEDWWDQLTEEQKQNINLGVQQLEQGQGITHDKVRTQIDQLISKFKD